jgi:hypothetical protein
MRLTTPSLLLTLSRQTPDLILDSTRSTTLSLLSRQTPDLIASMMSRGLFSNMQDFIFTADLPVFALTGMAWLVVMLDVVFIMMGVL